MKNVNTVGSYFNFRLVASALLRLHPHSCPASTQSNLSSQGRENISQGRDNILYNCMYAAAEVAEFIC